MNTTRTTTRIPIKVYQVITKLAQTDGRSVNSMLVQLLKEALKSRGLLQ